MIQKHKIYNKFLIIAYSIILSVFLNNPVNAKAEKNFKQVEATGRAVLVDGNIEVSRKRALEDALYLAALKGGADINGFSAITSNTVINDQSIVRATNRVIDFKILNEKQDKEFISIKISAVVGRKTSLQKCKARPININLLKGIFKVQSNVPSKLARKMPVWYSDTYEVISQLPNVEVNNYKNSSLKKIIKSNINSSFDYNALTKGLPKIQEGDYSIVPELILIPNNIQNNFSNYLLKVSLNIYSGSYYKLMMSRTYELPIKYQFKSNFQFFKNVSTLNINLVDKKIKKHLVSIASKFVQEINCRPLQGKLMVSEGKLRIELGRKQGLEHKQIGLVKGLNIKNSMLSNSSVIVHANNVYENYSILLPLNDNIKLATLDNLVVEFVE